MKQSNKLSIFASSPTGQALNNPKSWLQFYQHEDNTIENRIYITAKFNVKNVEAIVIIDENAEKNKCGSKQQKFLVYLAFSPKKNIVRITTRIHKPCFYKNKASLKLNIKTKNGERYYNRTVLEAHPNAFDPVSQ